MTESNKGISTKSERERKGTNRERGTEKSDRKKEASNSEIRKRIT